MKSFDPKKIPLGDLFSLITGGVAPRPIALVSTISEDGVDNVAPFSFFNAMGCNPPIVVFSPARRGRDGTTKDTYDNLISTKECVVQVVTYDMVEQVNLASAEFDSTENEFTKSGLTPIVSERVKSKRVKESPFHMECHLREMIPLEEKPGSGNLAVCEIVLLHVADRIFSGSQIDPHKIDLVGRNGGALYTRASGDAIFDVPKPTSKTLIGHDGLPQSVKASHIFSANDLGRLANREALPKKEDISSFMDTFETIETTEKQFQSFSKARDYKKMFHTAHSLSKNKHSKGKMFIEEAAKCALEQNDVDFAWKAILSCDI